MPPSTRGWRHWQVRWESIVDSGVPSSGSSSSFGARAGLVFCSTIDRMGSLGWNGVLVERGRAGAVRLGDIGADSYTCTSSGVTSAKRNLRPVRLDRRVLLVAGKGDVTERSSARERASHRRPKLNLPVRPIFSRLLTRRTPGLVANPPDTQCGVGEATRATCSVV